MKSIRQLINALTAACALLASAAALAESARLTVHVDRPGKTISPLLFGSNIQWEHSGDGVLIPGAAGRPDAWFPGLVEAAREARVSVLRFPGGDLTNTYRWKSGLGPREQRPTGLSYGGSEIPSLFGSEEFMRLTRSIGAQPLIAVNLAAGAEEAADWVEYFNGAAGTTWGKRRVAAGFPQPFTVRYWEIGNEIYNPNQHGHMSAEAYGRRIVEFARAMRKRDPTIRIGAHLEASFLQAPWMPPIYPHMATWNESLLKVVGKDIDFAILHFYVPHDKIWNDKTLTRLVWAGPLVFEQNLATIRTLLTRYSRPDIEIALTEYGTYFGEKLMLSKRIESTEGALFNSMLLFSLIRDGGIVMANHWSLINNSRFGMLEAKPGKPLLLRPNYQSFAALSSLGGKTLLPVTYAGPTYRVDARGNISTQSQVPLLDAVAGRDEHTGQTTLAVVNRSLDGPVDVEIVAGSQAGTATTLYAEGAYEMSFRSSPSATLAAGSDARLRHRLLPNSLTMFVLR
jgi:alpha-N-arabinofuranosidase